MIKNDLIPLNSIILSLLANGTSFLVSILITLFIPNAYGFDTYSYYQLFIFYSSFIGFLHFGFINGFYIQYGNKNTESSNRERVSTQFLLFTLYVLLISAVIFFSIDFLALNSINLKIGKLISFNIFAVLINTFLQYYSLSKNDIKSHSISLVLDRLWFLIGLSVSFLLKNTNFETVIYIEIFSKIISAAFLVSINKELIFKPRFSIDLLDEVINHFRIGIKLLFSELLSLFSFGIIRNLINSKLGINDFGKFSLALSLINIVLLVVNSASIIIFPAIKNLNVSEKMKFFNQLENKLIGYSIITIITLIMPLYFFIKFWFKDLNNLSDIFLILYPVVLLEVKFRIIDTNYVLSLREEMKFLKIYIGVFIFSFLMIKIYGIFLVNISSFSYMFLFLYLLRNILSQYILYSYDNSKSFFVKYKEILLVIFYETTLFLFGWSLLMCILYLSIILFVIYYLYFYKSNLLNRRSR